MKLTNTLKAGKFNKPKPINLEIQDIVNHAYHHLALLLIRGEEAYEKFISEENKELIKKLDLKSATKL